MANTSEKNYFDILPYEVKVYLFSYLTSRDLKVLSRIPYFENLTYERSLIRKVSFYKTPKCDNSITFLTHRNRCEIITSLNITGVYWIQQNLLSSAISKLVNLQCLYAIGTQFDYNESHIKLLNLLLQLTTLSLTARIWVDVTEKLPKQIVNFYLHSSSTRALLQIADSVCKSSNVEEFWVIEHSLSSQPEPPLDYSNVGNLRKFVHCIYPYLRHGEYSIDNMKLTFVGCTEGQLMFENKKNVEFNRDGYKPWGHDDSCWKAYFEKTKQRPFSFNDSRKLMISKRPSDLEYTELNMMHDRYAFCNNLHAMVHSILMSQNMKKLRKLSISFCLCKKPRPIVHITTAEFKKKRVGVPKNYPGKTSLEDIVLNCPFIEELEIWECRSNDSTAVVTEEALLCIGKLKNLKKLSLNEFPIYINGTVLSKLCSNLPNLKSLKINSNTSHSTLGQGVCKSLESLPMLQDLRYEQPYINFEYFFDSVCTLKNLKLERLVLYCRSGEFSKDNQSLRKFLSKNKQLRFFFIKVNHIMHVPKHLREIVKKYRSLWHAYFVKETILDANHEMHLLPMDTWEMVYNVPAISVLNPFNHYVK